ncbi:MAG: hypothetical protein UY00_C0044G0008, partial [Candidatus Wolfebacteria bacterium GW2011_GWA1_47_6]
PHQLLRFVVLAFPTARKGRWAALPFPFVPFAVPLLAEQRSVAAVRAPVVLPVASMLKPAVAESALVAELPGSELALTRALWPAA